MPVETESQHVCDTYIGTSVEEVKFTWHFGTLQKSIFGGNARSREVTRLTVRARCNALQQSSYIDSLRIKKEKFELIYFDIALASR